MTRLMAPAVVPVRRSNDAMRVAMDAAQASLDQFLAIVGDPRPNQQKFLVRIFFVHQDQVEHIWMENLDMSSSPFSGALANDPRLPGLAFGQRKTFVKDRITDWMYFEDGKMVGGYTTKVLLKDQKAQRLAGIRRLFGSWHTTSPHGTFEASDL